jgi:hypothetical protein
MMVNEMALEGLQPRQIFILQTANSTYLFSLIDPTNGIGRLSGGIFGNRPTTASFLSSVSAQEDYQAEDCGKVKVGSRAVFIYDSPAGLNHFITSPIVKLSHTT